MDCGRLLAAKGEETTLEMIKVKIKIQGGEEAGVI